MNCECCSSAFLQWFCQPFGEAGSEPESGNPALESAWWWGGSYRRLLVGGGELPAPAEFGGWPSGKSPKIPATGGSLPPAIPPLCYSREMIEVP